VLIVDDNVQLAENIAEILQIEGFLTEVAGSAEEALPRALAEEVHAMVTDFRLPGMTGAALVSEVRRHRRHLHAIVISAYTDDETMGAARTAGAHFLPKPVDFLLLSRMVRVRE
jgi:DNA-binding response OmpR family regulator